MLINGNGFKLIEQEVHLISIDGSYVDGGGATSSGTIPAITTGTFGERAGQADYTGYFSNFILINGANRGSIATPTSPLTAD